MKVFEIFFYYGNFDIKLNASFIALIPKCFILIELNDYRPICLVGCIYKILSKMLANRMRDVAKKVIGSNQFSFAKGKQILDCSLVANKFIHEIKKMG